MITARCICGEQADVIFYGRPWCASCAGTIWPAGVPQDVPADRAILPEAIVVECRVCGAWRWLDDVDHCLVCGSPDVRAVKLG